MSLKDFLARQRQRHLAIAATRAKVAAKTQSFDPTAERVARVTMEYMQAQEKAQREVIMAWESFLETNLALALKETEAEPEECELVYHPPAVDYSGTVEVWIRGVHHMNVYRHNTNGALDSGIPVEWEFHTEKVV